MRVTIFAATGAAALGFAVLALPRVALADELLAGTVLTTATQSQPICRNEGSLEGFLAAGLDHAPLRPYLKDCTYAPPGARVDVLEDLPIRNQVMHVIKVRVAFPYPLRATTGYTYSLGFLPPGYRYGAGYTYQPYTIPSGVGFGR